MRTVASFLPKIAFHRYEVAYTYLDHLSDRHHFGFPPAQRAVRTGRDNRSIQFSVDLIERVESASPSFLSISTAKPDLSSRDFVAFETT
jgi:hypothetical protein